jgi:predicted alpha/beta superfamily hydrolase
MSQSGTVGIVPDAKLPLGATEVHDLWSAQVEDTFRVFVADCGDAPQVTILVTDGNGLFGLVVDTIRLMQIPALLPSMLVVGIGYPGVDAVADTIDMRTRDLTPTSWPVYPGGGGADRFLSFIRGTLFDWIAYRFPTALASTVYFGHSLGGLFGAHALLGEQPVFSHSILSSPSLFWDSYAIFDREAQRAASAPDLVAATFFGIGALETDQGRRLEGRHLPLGHPRRPPATYLDMVDDLLRFTNALRSRCYPSLDMEVAVYPDEFHATVPASVLSHGLRRFFSSC